MVIRSVINTCVNIEFFVLLKVSHIIGRCYVM